MRILVIGAGQVGTAIVEALHTEHDVTVVDIDADRLAVLSYRYDILTVTGNAVTRGTLMQAGVHVSDLVIACTDRDEINIVAGILTRSLSKARLVIRTKAP
jgi:trk system potassium uptake protein TrkA